MTTRVKNKAAAPVQISAEQLLREAAERQLESDQAAPRSKIVDAEELAEYQLSKRTTFENGIRRNRTSIGNWLAYAQWEASQNQFERARSVFERAIDQDYQNLVIWIKYAELEMKHQNVNHARNIFDRAVALLPRQDQLWLRYSLMEETLGNYAAVRLVFQRWMEWEPDEIGWNAYIKFEMRYGEADRARQVFRKFVVVHPKVATYLKWANFEQKLGEVANARAVFENCHEFLGADAETEEYFVAFAQFEESNHEVERARAIYRFALDRVDKARAAEIYRAYVAFEKQFGDRDGIETVIAGRRRFHFEEELKENPRNYDAWYDYAKLEEQYGANAEAVREVYERAIANVPPVAEKRFWRRYIWLWINYAVFEELSAQDVSRARAVWAECVRVVPHAQFSFTKVWTMYALFEVRHGDLSAARKVFGAGLGLAAKPKLFRNYLELETKLGEIDRVRKLYGALLERFPQHAQGWVDFAALEASLQEVVRTRAIFELAIQQQGMDTPELVWKSYIDWELESGRHAEARQLYGRLLGFTQHPRVFESFARFEYSLGNVEAARAVYVRGIDGDLKTEDTKNERWELLQLLKDFEDDVADAHKGEAQYDFIQQRMPKRVKKKRTNATGVVEEVYDYRFPDMEVSKPGAKLLEAAAAWKRAKTAEGGQPQ